MIWKSGVCVEEKSICKIRSSLVSIIYGKDVYIRELINAEMKVKNKPNEKREINRNVYVSAKRKCVGSGEVEPTKK